MEDIKKPNDMPVRAADTKVSKVNSKKNLPAGPDLGKTIEEGFRRPWKFKSLWFYGVLLAIFAGGSSYSSSNFGDSNKPPDIAKIKGIWESIPVSTWILIGTIIGILALIFIIIGLIVGNWSLAAIIRGNIKIENGELITRKEIGKTGKAPVWGLVKLNFFLPIFIFFGLMLSIFVLGAVCALIGKPYGIIIGVIVGVIGIIALIPVAIYFGIVWLMASRFVVIENKKTIEAIRSSRNLLKGNFWMTLLLAFIASFISGCGSCLGSVVLVIGLFGVIGFIVAKIYFGAILMGGVVLGGFIVYVLVAGYFKAFSESSLTIWWSGLKKIK